MVDLVGNEPDQVPSNADLGAMAYKDDVNYGRRVDVPATAAAQGRAGDYAYDTSYFYICVSLNTWQRTATATW